MMATAATPTSVPRGNPKDAVVTHNMKQIKRPVMIRARISMIDDDSVNRGGGIV